MAGLHRRPSRRAIAAGAAFVLLLGSGVALLNQQDRATGEAPPAVPPSPTIAEQAQRAAGEVTARLAPLQLPELVAAAARAAAAYARGEAVAPANIALANNRFEITLAFGCHGADRAAQLPLSWSYDDGRQALTLRATPQNWPTSRFAPDPTETGQIEAIEGFWIPRPWLPTGECPAPITPPAAQPPISTPVDPGSTASASTTDAPPPEQAASVTEPRRTVGIAQFFPPGVSRWRQRAGKAYEIVARLPPEELQRTRGFELILRGRVAPLPNGQIVRCHSDDAEVEPVCLVSVEITSVAFRDPRDGKLLAEWNS